MFEELTKAMFSNDSIERIKANNDKEQEILAEIVEIGNGE